MQTRAVPCCVSATRPPAHAQPAQRLRGALATIQIGVQRRALTRGAKCSALLLAASPDGGRINIPLPIPWPPCYHTSQNPWPLIHQLPPLMLATTHPKIFYAYSYQSMEVALWADL